MIERNLREIYTWVSYWQRDVSVLKKPKNVSRFSPQTRFSTMMSTRFIATAVQRQLFRRSNAVTSQSVRCFSFSFAGPRKLDDIMKKELVEDKSPTEVADIWYTYHEGKVRKRKCCSNKRVNFLTFLTL